MPHVGYAIPVRIFPYSLGIVSWQSLLPTGHLFFSMNRYLHLFATVTTICAFVLICSGGLVTSKGAGMSVPDWPTTYGYNMFLFPVSRWIGGVLYEHTHRLLASAVGALTLLLTAYVLVVEKRHWVRVIATLTCASVIFQGILGGLRVTLNASLIGIFHGMVAQSFLSLLGVLAVVTGTPFLSGEYTGFRVVRELKWVTMIVTGVIFTQLAVAASMRHAHTGLSIPDFPTAYGKWWPSLDSASVARINDMRAAHGQAATSAAQIALQMVHRALAVLAFAGVVMFAWLTRHIYPLNRWGKIWVLLVAIQIGLGIWTIWSNKAADIATAHVSIGALVFFLGVQLTFWLFCAADNHIRLLSKS